jgi:glycosyltransferase involved in cell wall biosynthesis
MTHHMMTPSLAVGKHRAMRYSSSAFQRLSYWLFRRYASAVFVYDSEEGRRITSFLRSRGYDDAKIKHVMNGTSRKEIDSIDVNPNLPEYDACFVGGLRPGKGLYDIVPIWKRVLASAPTARLAVIGGGAPVYEHELRAEMKTEAMQDSVVLYGNLRWTELIGIVKRSKIFISPSHEEGWGIAICEALTCGKAVIAYDLPAYGVFGDCIEKVERNDVDAFASAVVEFLCNPTRREELAKKGRLLSAKFDWDSIAQRDAQLFVDVCTAGEQKVSQVNWPPQPSMGVPATACEIK